MKHRERHYNLTKEEQEELIADIRKYKYTVSDIMDKWRFSRTNAQWYRSRAGIQRKLSYIKDENLDEKIKALEAGFRELKTTEIIAKENGWNVRHLEYICTRFKVRQRILGKFDGRTATLAAINRDRTRSLEMKRLLELGLSPREISEKLEIHFGSYYRLKRKYNL